MGYYFYKDSINGWFNDVNKEMLKAKGLSFLKINRVYSDGKTYSKCKAKD